MRRNSLFRLLTTSTAISFALAAAPDAVGSADVPYPTKPFNLVQDFSGQSFFEGWDFYGYWDNLTLGNVNWVDEANATALQLAYINSAGNAIIKVDNTTTVLPGDNRNAVRITTQALYGLGSVWIVDFLHLPYGCSVWPAFWAVGPNWPEDGEIDIVEAVNLMTNNQMALHTTPGCFHTTPAYQLGTSGDDGLDDCSPGSGCVVAETKADSFGPDFATNGGGVWATIFDVSGIFIWYWPRASIPASISSSTSTSSSIDPSDWGQPSAAYVNSSCDIQTFFTSQQIVIDTTLCGDWAGIDPVYNPTCGTGPTGLCYNDSVVGPGDKFDNAYFEISYFRAYTTGVPSATPTPTPSGGSNGGGPVVTITSTATANPTSKAKSSSAAPQADMLRWALTPFLVLGTAVGMGLVLL